MNDLKMKILKIKTELFKSKMTSKMNEIFKNCGKLQK